MGMGHVGNAVCHNLLRKGYKVTAINDISGRVPNLGGQHGHGKPGIPKRTEWLLRRYEIT